MANIVKQVVGIDVAQKELVVSLGRMHNDMESEIFAYKTFGNNKKGFNDLVAWVQKTLSKEIKVRYVMEATGVYHEALVYYLSDHGYDVSVVLPNKISNYFKTLDIKTITDKTASQTICHFGLGRKLDTWTRPKKIFRDLKQLTRERDQIVSERTIVKNQLHAEQAEAFPNERSIARVNQRIQLLNDQEREIKAEIAGLVKHDNELVKKIDKIITIPGIGKLTAVIILAETNGFELIRNKKQLTSYSGLDVREKVSGTSVKGKPKISKKGNRHLRKAMHLPALAAIRHSEQFKSTFVRLVSRHGIKMKSAVAIQRKLLELVYTLWKNDTVYDEKHFQQSNNKAA